MSQRNLKCTVCSGSHSRLHCTFICKSCGGNYRQCECETVNRQSRPNKRQRNAEARETDSVTTKELRNNKELQKRYDSLLKDHKDLHKPSEIRKKKHNFLDSSWRKRRKSTKKLRMMPKSWPTWFEQSVKP